jgi:competence protein ComEC
MDFFIIGFPPLPEQGLEGTAYLKIHSLSSHSGFLGKSWIYQADIQSFITKDGHILQAYRLPCSVRLPHHPLLVRPPAHCDYVVSGRLQEKGNGFYAFKVKKETPWFPVKDSWSLAEYRFEAKQWLKSFIQHHIAHPQSASFLAGIATGEFDDRRLSFEFSRFGLQHIMAISGLHFGILAASIGFFLQLCLPSRAQTIALIIFLSLYFLFLGNNPSIMRAWNMICLSLLGTLIKTKSNVLNTLGVALLIVLIIDPLLCQQIGFQFSFLCTAAILLAYPSADFFLTACITKRPLSQMILMNRWNQLGYCLLTLFRKGLALTLAIHLFSLPLILYHFQKFPWMGLIYNFFFPFFVSLALFLLVLGSLLNFLVPWIGTWIHTLNNFYTQTMLKIVYGMPVSVDSYLRYNEVSDWMLILYLSSLCLIVILIKSYLDQKRFEKVEWAFL